MSIDAESERATALRIATVANRYTPEDAARELIRALSHVEQARQDWERGEGHSTEECDMCTRVATWLPMLEGARTFVPDGRGGWHQL